MKKTLLTTLLAAVMFIVTAATCDAAEHGSTDEVSKAVALLNELRESKGLDALHWNPDSPLQRATEVRAEEIATSFSHTRPDGSSCFTVFKTFDVRYSYAGENIAMGTNLSPDGAIDLWTNSPGHYANMISENFTKVGLASWHADDGNIYWVQMFIS